MDAEIKNLRIDRAKKQSSGDSPSWATRVIIGGILLFVLAGLGRYFYGTLDRAPEVEAYRVKSAATASSNGLAQTTILNATGYVVAHHKIQVASKVVGRVLWIGVEKGDRVREGQVIVRL